MRFLEYHITIFSNHLIFLQFKISTLKNKQNTTLCKELTQFVLFCVHERELLKSITWKFTAASIKVSQRFNSQQTACSTLLYRLDISEECLFWWNLPPWMEWPIASLHHLQLCNSFCPMYQDKQTFLCAFVRHNVCLIWTN